MLTFIKGTGAEREGLLVTKWLTESSAYQHWQSIMVSHIAVDQFNSWDSSINMSPPDQHMDLDIWHGKSQLCSWSIALWDTIIDCKDLNAELKINHVVTRRTLPTARGVQWEWHSNKKLDCKHAVSCVPVFSLAYLQTPSQISAKECQGELQLC